MRLYLTLAIAALLITSTASAQHLNMGIKGGANFYTIQNDNGVKYDIRTGYHFGLLAHMHADKQIALQPEFVYSSQGAIHTLAGVETVIKLNYINVPLLFQIMFDNGFRFQAGPQISFLIGAESVTGNSEVSIKDDLKPMVYAVVGGLSYVKPATGFGVDIRYNYGLANINETGTVTSTNQGFQIGLFYLLNHK